MKIFNLIDQVAVITGGSQGIGFAIAKGFAEAGATVVTVNRNSLKGGKAAESLKSEGLKVSAIAADVRDESSITNLVSKVIENFGKVDILVNCAAIALRKPTLEFTRADWDNIMNTNLWGTFLCCQTFGKEMIRQKNGKIINFSSDIAQRAMANRSVYAVSKAGVTHMTHCLALEWAKYNIRVNAIAPGTTITDMNKEYFETNPDKLTRAINFAPLGRVGDVSDHVGAAIFLASDASDFITGQTFFIDGGTNIW